jgi:hypothetical protein
MKDQRSELSYVLKAAIASMTLAYLRTIGRASFQPMTFEYGVTPFYCGGAVTAAHRDPYLLEPLRTCEHASVLPVVIGALYRTLRRFFRTKSGPGTDGPVAAAALAKVFAAVVLAQPYLRVIPSHGRVLPVVAVISREAFRARERFAPA